MDTNTIPIQPMSRAERHRKAQPSGLGKRLRAVRLSRRWSQATLARETHGAMTQQTIEQIERGVIQNPRILTVCALARALAISLLTLVEGDAPDAPT